MSQSSKEDIIKTVRYHYQRAERRAERSELLNHLCQVTGWERKYALKRLHGQRGPSSRTKTDPRPRGGSQATYTSHEIGILKALWLKAEQPCGKRLKAVIDLWLPSWEVHHGALCPLTKAKLSKISPAQIDRVLQPFKVQSGRPRPRIGNDVRGQIPLRTGPWDVSGPGWIEADTVAHCGGNMSGCFAWSIVLTDIATQWTECRASWNRSDRVVHQRIKQIESSLPFPILGFDSDNGGEFINHLLHRYFTHRTPPVQLTRSRPYRKNDNAHVEQKNRALIRQFVGYERLDVMNSIDPLNELLTQWSLWNNLFSPTLKLISKERIGTKVKKIYEKKAQTAAMRMLASGNASPQAKATVSELLKQYDPITLKQQIEHSHKALWAIIRKASSTEGTEG